METADFQRFSDNVGNRTSSLGGLVKVAQTSGLQGKCGQQNVRRQAFVEFLLLFFPNTSPSLVVRRPWGLVTSDSPCYVGDCSSPTSPCRKLWLPTQYTHTHHAHTHTPPVCHKSHSYTRRSAYSFTKHLQPSGKPRRAAHLSAGARAPPLSGSTGWKARH